MIPGLTKEEMDIVWNALRSSFPVGTIYFFGSRVRGNHKPFSDLDVCVNVGATVPLGTLNQLKEELSNSNLAFRVDISDWHRITPEFQQAIVKTGVKL